MTFTLDCIPGSRRMIPVNQDFMCGICEQYLKEPKELPCRHGFCCACLRAHSVKTGKGSGFPCPTCEKDVKIDANGIPLIEFPDQIPTNKIKERQLEKFHTIKEKKVVNICGFCFSKWRTTPATKYCRACEQYFCNECGNQHWLLRSSKEHRVWLIEDINELKIDPYIRAYLALMFNARIKTSPRQNVQNLVDSETCRITGSSYLPDGRMVVLDSSNQKLKLFDRSLICRFQESTPGHDVLVVNKTMLVVTCPSLNNIFYFTITNDGFKKESVLETEFKCFGLTNKDLDSFYTATAGSRVSILQYKETTLFDEIVVSPGKVQMNTPYYIAYSVTNDLFCISDLISKCVKSVSSSGDVLWERKIDDCSAVISFADYFLLGRQDRKTVDVIRPDGQLLKSLLTTSDALSSVMVLSADTWKLDLNKIRITVIDDTELIYIYTAEDPLSELDWSTYSRGTRISSQQTSGGSGGSSSKLCTIL